MSTQIIYAHDHLRVSDDRQITNFGHTERLSHNHNRDAAAVTSGYANKADAIAKGAKNWCNHHVPYHGFITALQNDIGGGGWSAQKMVTKITNVHNNMGVAAPPMPKDNNNTFMRHQIIAGFDSVMRNVINHGANMFYWPDNAGVDETHGDAGGTRKDYPTKGTNLHPFKNKNKTAANVTVNLQATSNTIEAQFPATP